MIGRRYRIGDAEIEVTRPAMRCAATTVDPTTAETALNLPVILRKLTGHLFCGVYARVTRSGDIARDEPLVDLGLWDGNPSETLPARTPPPEQWPRLLKLADANSSSLVLRNPSVNWPLPAAPAGSRVRIHPVSGAPDRMAQLPLQRESTPSELVLELQGALAGIDSVAQLLVSGPYAEPSADLRLTER